MNKKVKYTFGGTNQDISKAKHPLQYYFDGQHIRITATDSQSSGALTNEKGTELVITLPSITIVGKVNIPIIAVDNSVILTEQLSTKDIDVLANDTFLDDVTITIVAAPTTGTVIILPNNRLRYTDVSGLNGNTDTFTYQIDDGTTQATAQVNVNMKLGKLTPPGDVLLTDNFDGTFYYYSFRPCDRTYETFNGKSRTKISDNRVVYFYGSLGVGLLGSVSNKIIPQSTSWTTSGVEFASVCPPQDKILPIQL